MTEKEVERQNPCIDRGWAWVVMISSFFLEGITQGFAISVGVLVTEWLITFPNSHSEIAWIASICGGLGYLGAPIANVLSSRFSHRRVILAGSAMAAAGTLLSSFATNTYMLYVTFGVLAGLGNACIYNPAAIFVGLYFRKYQAFAMGFATVGAGFGPVLFAPLMSRLISNLGWRGAMVVTSCILLNGCVFGSLLTPVGFWSKHYVKASQTQVSAKVSKGSLISNIVIPSLLKDPKLYILFLNKTLWNFGSFIFWTFLVDYSIGRGLSPESGALVISVLNATSIASKVILSVFMHLCPRVSPSIIYLASTITAGILALILPLCEMGAVFWIVVGVYGMSFGGLCASFGIATVRWFGIEHCTQAFGYVMAGGGLGAILGPPAAGFIYDAYNRYEEAFYLAGSALTLSGLILIPMECIYRKQTLNELPIAT